MQRTEMGSVKHPAAPWACAGVAVLALAVAGGVSAQGLTISNLQIESTPTAAEVELIGGKAGVTPLTISERDIYPNTYPDDRADLYGMVVLRHPGCETLRHRVAQSETRRGLHLRLDCANLATQAAVSPPEASPIASIAPPTAAPSETMSQRRLRQLQVLQELLDEGLISPAEEQRVRRQILQAVASPENAR